MPPPVAGGFADCGGSAAAERRLARISVAVPAGDRPMRAIELLARPEGSIADLARRGIASEIPPAWSDCIEVRIRYRGYIERQQRTAEKSAALDHVLLPVSLWDDELVGVSHEAREKLRRWRPATMGQASRISGVSPSDVAVLMVYARRGRASPAVAAS